MYFSVAVPTMLRKFCFGLVLQIWLVVLGKSDLRHLTWPCILVDIQCIFVAYKTFSMMFVCLQTVQEGRSPAIGQRLCFQGLHIPNGNDYSSPTVWLHNWRGTLTTFCSYIIMMTDEQYSMRFVYQKELKIESQTCVNCWFSGTNHICRPSLWWI